MQPADLPALAALKADPRVFAVMLGGVRNRVRAADELAADIAAWSAHGYGTWAVRQRDNDAFLGLTALQDRADGRGVAVRFARPPAPPCCSATNTPALRAWWRWRASLITAPA